MTRLLSLLSLLSRGRALDLSPPRPSRHTLKKGIYLYIPEDRDGPTEAPTIATIATIGLAAASWGGSDGVRS